MTPLFIGGLGVPELLIILAVVLLLFGGARLAGIGKSTGRAIKEFKEETRGLRDADKDKNNEAPPAVESEVVREQPPASRTASDRSTGEPWRDA